MHKPKRPFKPHGFILHTVHALLVERGLPVVTIPTLMYLLHPLTFRQVVAVDSGFLILVL